MIKRIIFTALFFILTVNPVIAQVTAQIELSASKSEVSAGETFQVSVRVKNAGMGSAKIGDVRVYGIENFEQKSSSQSTQVQTINGATAVLTEVVITLAALKEGEYNIGPAEINTGGVNTKSNTLSIKVGQKKIGSFFNSKDDNSPAPAAKKTNNGFNKDWLLNTAAFLLLAIFVYSLYKRKRQTEKDIYEHREIEKTKRGIKIKIPDKNDDKFFKKIKKQLLIYLQKKYEIDTAGLTSQELAEKLTDRGARDKDNIIKALKICDQGSFALNVSGKDKLLEIINNL